MELNDFSRQGELLNITKARAIMGPIHIIGAGAVGSWAALFLAKLGFAQNLRVYDFDVVEEHNIPNQAFGMRDVGVPKVVALRRVLEATIGATLPPEHFINKAVSGTDFLYTEGAVVLAADSMSVRREVFNYCSKFTPDKIWFYAEARMGLDESQVYILNDLTDTVTCERYAETLKYEDADAEVSACGASMSAITTAVLTAEMLVRNIVEHANFLVAKGMTMVLDEEFPAPYVKPPAYIELHSGFNKFVAID